MSDPSASPPGWYDDPEHPGHRRYWNGQVWGPSQAPNPAATSATAKPRPSVGLGCLAWLLIALAVIAVAGIILNAATGRTQSGDRAVDRQKYEQTWKTPYPKTTCRDWETKMTKHENFVMAGDIIFDSWPENQRDHLPDDAVINEMVRIITKFCGTPIMASEGPLFGGRFAIKSDPVVFKP